MTLPRNQNELLAYKLEVAAITLEQARQHVASASRHGLTTEDALRDLERWSVERRELAKDPTRAWLEGHRP